MTAIPTVHLNGTSIQELAQQVKEALEATRAAQVKLIEASPNQRDYYPSGDDYWKLALQEHRGRMAMLARVVDELREIYLGIVDQDQRGELG